MKDCLFCKIISGEIPSYKIYEDENVYAFLDISNDILGHTLVVPKFHCENIFDCQQTVLANLMFAVQKISLHFIKDCGFTGVNVINNSGESAEQRVMHLHFHILPRTQDDGVQIWRDFDKQEKSLQEICDMFAIKTENQEDALESFKEDCDVLYTDGACSNNPGAGGFGGIYLPKQGPSLEYSGGEKLTTNNRMELMAVIEGLKLVAEGETVKVYSDSAYVVNAFLQNWISGWVRNNWKTSSGGQVLNMDLWKELIALVSKRNVQFVKVKGHSDNVLNNRCDELARNEVKKFS